MLTADLVRARLRKGVLVPEYVDAEDQDLLGLAERMIDIFERHVGCPQRELNSNLRDFLGTGTAFLLHRGLAKLLRDRCELETVAPVEPESLREAVFHAAADAYRSGDKFHFDRDAVRAKICAEIEVPEELFEHNLYADLKDEQIVTSFERCEPKWLLARYNVALAQAALLRATSLVVRVTDSSPARCREMFRSMKFCRLLFDVCTLDDGGYEIRLDGPLSMFKSSQKYGVQMAQFFPTLLHLEHFTVEATVLHGPKRREVDFRIDSSAQRLLPIRPLRGQWRPEEIEWLEGRFKKLDTDWRISTEAELIDLGGQGILVTDATFTHRPTKTKAYLEILGYWRRGSVASRLQALRERGPANMILAVGKDLHIDEDTLEDLPAEVVLFRATPIAKDVLAALDRLLEH